jgi:hypothetical protein
MNQKHPSGATSLTLANQTTVEPNVIRGPDADTQNRKLTVDSDAPSANPFLNLATGRKTSSRKRFLKPLAFLAALTTSASITRCRLRVAISRDIKLFARRIIAELDRRLPTPTFRCSQSVPGGVPVMPAPSFAAPRATASNTATAVGTTAAISTSALRTTSRDPTAAAISTPIRCAIAYRTACAAAGAGRTARGATGAATSPPPATGRVGIVSGFTRHVDL